MTSPWVPLAWDECQLLPVRCLVWFRQDPPAYAVEILNGRRVVREPLGLAAGDGFLVRTLVTALGTSTTQAAKDLGLDARRLRRWMTGAVALDSDVRDILLWRLDVAGADTSH